MEFNGLTDLLRMAEVKKQLEYSTIWFKVVSGRIM